MPHTLMKQLTEMKLTGMAAALSSQMEQPGTYEELSFRERLALLVTRESLERDQRKQKRLLQKSRLRLEASVHGIDYQPARNLERSRIAQLSQSDEKAEPRRTDTGHAAKPLCPDSVGQSQRRPGSGLSYGVRGRR